MTTVLDEIRRLFGEGTLAGLTDAQLLERFAARGDGEAFAALVNRHGPLVLAVCRSALGPRHEADVDDAFQATFLVLVRRSGSFPLHGSLAGWLYCVARRVARQARIESARRRRRERVAADRREANPPPDPARDELRRLVHQELDHLPERYRMPLLLCDLHGLTRDEAAAAIGCPPGTVAGRLARARDQLRSRLTRRGVAPSAALPSLSALGADDPPQLLRQATEAALAAARGEGLPTAAAHLAAAASRGLLTPRAPLALLLLAALAVAGVATAHRNDRPDHAPVEGQAAPAPAPAPQARTEPPAPIDPDDPATADLFAGRVVDLEGRPVAGARIYLVPWSLDPGSSAPSGPGAVRAVTATDGRFRFSARDLTFPALDGLPARRPGLLIAAAEGHGPDWVRTWGQTSASFVSHSDPVKAAEWTLTLPPDDVPIRGRLLDAQGRPLDGSTVTLTALHVPLDQDLDAHLERQHSPHALFLSIDYDRTLDEPGLLPGVSTTAVTDAAGRFRLDGLGRDRLAQLTLRAPGMVDTSIQVMTRAAPDVRSRPQGASRDFVTYGADFTLTLPPGRTVAGLVRDASTGAPLPGAWISAGLDAIRALETGSHPQTTDPGGHFTLSGLDPDRKDLDVLAVPAPGQPCFLATARIAASGDTLVDCPRGIPFRLTLRNQAGEPVEAVVTYSAIQPNPFFHERLQPILVQAGSPLSRAARQPDGSYLGVALPGPGVVLAELPRGAGGRPARVDPKAFFAPGKTDWTPQDQITAYGTVDTLSVCSFYGGGWIGQDDYAAIVLVNPAEDSGRLELEATVVPDQPRQVTLLDPEGRPVVGVESSGLTYHPWDREPRLRAATVPITGLHPDRARRITFVKPDRKLIGALLARGDGDAPYTVRLQPWATVTGRIVDAQGRPLGVEGPQGKSQPKATLSTGTVRESAARDDPGAGIIPDTSTDDHGRFRVERLVPGLGYTAEIYLDNGRSGGRAFEGLKLAPGEVRDLGDIRIRPTAPEPPRRP